MQNTANSPTAPTPDQPTGQFSGDDIEFEPFMFDQGSGPLSASSLVDRSASARVEEAPRNQADQAAGAPDITGEATETVPTPYMSAEPAPRPIQPIQPRPTQQPPADDATTGRRITGPLGRTHTDTHLSARLSQAQEQGQASPPQPRPDADIDFLTLRGTGPLGGDPLRPEIPADVYAGSVQAKWGSPEPPAEQAGQDQPYRPGPINPAYFRTPTGPLGRPPEQADDQLATTTAASTTLPTRTSSGPLNASYLRSPSGAVAEQEPPGAEPRVLSPTEWSDSTLSSVEDFSAVLLAMLGRQVTVLPASVDEAPQPTGFAQEPERESLPTEKSPSLSRIVPLEQAPSFGGFAATRTAETAVRGQDEMTGAPPPLDYSVKPSRVVSPDYSGPALDAVAPFEEPNVVMGTAPHEAPPDQQPEQSDAVSGNVRADDLEFEEFMFDRGTVGPPMPNMQEFMPSVVGMEAALDVAPQQETPQAGYSQLEQPAAPEFMQVALEPASLQSPYAASETEPEYATVPEFMQPAPEQAEYGQPSEQLENQPPVQMQAEAETGQGSLPFWLQDTSNLEAIAGQGYVDLDFGAPPAEAPAPAQFSMEEATAPAEEAQAAPPITSGLQTSAPADVSAPLEMPEPVAAWEPAPASTPSHVPDQSLEQLEQASQVEDLPAYEDLPPIEPFDFSALNLIEEEEEFGFNTEELSGLMPSRNDPMRATADLDVLADIFDGTPVAGPLETPAPASTPASLMPMSPVASLLQPATEEEVASAAQAQAPTEQPTEQPKEQPADQVSGRQTTNLSGGWTSTVTSALTMDSLDDVEIDAFETGMLTRPSVGGTDALTDMDLDIEPFDYTQLNLEDELETVTGQLNSGQIAPAPEDVPAALDEQPIMQTTPPAVPQAEEEQPAEEEDTWRGTELDTSLFMPTQPAPTDQGAATYWLTGEGLTDEAEPELVAPEATHLPPYSSEADEQERIFKARVDWANNTDPDLSGPTTSLVQGAEDESELEAEEYIEQPQLQQLQPQAKEEWQVTPQVEQPQEQEVGAPVLEPASLMPNYAYQPLQAPELAPQPVPAQMPQVGAGRDIYTSGPLPELEGFEELHALVNQNPNDIGAHVALAAAYTQFGDMDTAIRVYRRILRKRNVSLAVLRLITEELNEFAGDLEGNPLFHQVRGDLYTRQGRNHEAIQEYNKIV